MSSSPSREPATVQDLVKPTEAEPGREVQFCPIRQLPIVQSLRVRTLPGFHLLSLDAGKEALARGFYTAYGEKFPCHHLEYLHPDDRVFICVEDNKAFLNEMSMRYHRYIGHELQERKAERKRLRERAEERKVRSAVHQAALQQQQQRHVRPPALRSEPPAEEQQERQQERQQQQLQQSPAPQSLQMPASPPILPQQEPESIEMIGVNAGDGAPSAATDDPYKATEDPYAGPTEDPYQAVELADAGASDAPDDKPAESAAESARLAAPVAVAPQDPTPTPPLPLAQHSLAAPLAAAAAVAAPVQAAPLVAAAPRTVAAAVAPPVAAAPPPPREDLYGDIGEGDSKRQKVASVYATAIGSMLDDNFDEDD